MQRRTAPAGKPPCPAQQLGTVGQPASAVARRTLCWKAARPASPACPAQPALHVVLEGGPPRLPCMPRPPPRPHRMLCWKAATRRVHSSASLAPYTIMVSWPSRMMRARLPAGHPGGSGEEPPEAGEHKPRASKGIARTGLDSRRGVGGELLRACTHDRRGRHVTHPAGSVQRAVQSICGTACVPAAACPLTAWRAAAEDCRAVAAGAQGLRHGGRRQQHRAGREIQQPAGTQRGRQHVGCRPEGHLLQGCLGVPPLLPAHALCKRAAAAQAAAEARAPQADAVQAWQAAAVQTTAEVAEVAPKQPACAAVARGRGGRRAQEERGWQRRRRASRGRQRAEQSGQPS